MIHTTIVGDGPNTIGFIHGLFGRGTNFRSIANSLSDNYTCVLIDAPNHGSSGWTSSLDLPDFGELILDHLVTMNLPGSLTLVGHSMGGKIVMYAALARPGNVDRLIVLDMSPVNYPIKAAFRPYVEAMKNLDLNQVTDRRSANRLMAKAVRNPKIRAFLLQNLRFSDGTWAWQLNLDLLERELDEIGVWHDFNRKYFGKTLWVGGQDSDFVQEKYEPEMRKFFPNTQKIIIKFAGHWVHSDQPEVVTQTIRFFAGQP